jgi:anthranilate phosphoribosyltransferase
MSITTHVQKLMDQRPLTRAETHAAFSEIMKGEVSPVLLTAILVALKVKGESVEELTGAAEAMREAAVPVSSDRKPVVDTCGTGGDGKSTFNVSTTAAFVVSGAGFVVAKHGNRSVSSPCGSADVLEALGIPIQSDAEQAAACLKNIGIAFLFAPAFHPATKHAMPVRKELGTRTIFNLLGPLTNPARPSAQLVGVYDPRWLKPMAEVLGKLGCEAAFVVHGQGEDEIALSGPTEVAELYQGQVRTETWRPEDFGYKAVPREEPKGRTPQEYARTLLEVLNGRLGYHRSVVCMNAAAAIRAAFRTKAGGGKNITLKEATILAQKSLDTKAALQKFEQLKEALLPSEDSRG